MGTYIADCIQFKLLKTGQPLMPLWQKLDGLLFLDHFVHEMSQRGKTEPTYRVGHKSDTFLVFEFLLLHLLHYIDVFK